MVEDEHFWPTVVIWLLLCGILAIRWFFPHIPYAMR